MIKPIEIKRADNNQLYTRWSDGYESSIELNVFRSECPCAVCKEDDLNNKKAVPSLISMYVKGKNELKGINIQGNYAIAATWGDGHDTGIYTFSLLREICEKNNKCNPAA
ncbi:MAG: DUF971 domain-containing protein [Candidatus Kapabacteria bacterium]|nr:DUF971 domain-containing protein [Candidatus Kapabacteria bacterium]